MRVIIQSDYQKMSQWAANHVIDRINEFNSRSQVCAGIANRFIASRNV